jgi:hypothetical protein
VPDDEAGRALLDTIARALPPGAELVAAGARAGTTAQMIRAFQWNLTALSLLALVVGMFLIYQTTAFSVVQRPAAHRLAPGHRRVARRDLRAGDGRGAPDRRRGHGRGPPARARHGAGAPRPGDAHDQRSVLRALGA